MKIVITYEFAHKGKVSTEISGDSASPEITDEAEKLAREMIPNRAVLMSVKWDSYDKKRFGARTF